MPNETGDTKPLSRSVRVQMPHGEVRHVKLPSASKVKIGGKGNILITYKGRIFLFWLIRIKGGWTPVQKSGFAKGIPDA